MIVSGVPDRIPNHASEILEMAIDMLVLINTIRDPVSGSPMRIRIGTLIFCFQFILNFQVD